MDVKSIFAEPTWRL